MSDLATAEGASAAGRTRSLISAHTGENACSVTLGAATGGASSSSVALTATGTAFRRACVEGVTRSMPRRSSKRRTRSPGILSSDGCLPSGHSMRTLEEACLSSGWKRWVAADAPSLRKRASTPSTTACPTALTVFAIRESSETSCQRATVSDSTFRLRNAVWTTIPLPKVTTGPSVDVGAPDGLSVRCPETDVRVCAKLWTTRC